MEKFKPNTLNYIDCIDEILKHLDLNEADIKNIRHNILNLEDGYLNYINEVEYQPDFEHIAEWVDFSIECIEHQYDLDYEEEDDCEIIKIIKSLKKFRNMCPQDLYIQRRFK